MPDGPRIKPRILDARAYERALHRGVLGPMIKTAQSRITAAGANYYAIREAIRSIPTDPNLDSLVKSLCRSN